MYVRSVFNNAVQGCQKGIVEMKEMHKQRNSNIELLRIIAMFMIIASHYPHGLSGTDLGYGANRYFYSIFTAFGQVGVGIFLLIMGYFMIDQKMTLKRFLRLYLDVICYSIVVFVLFAAFGRQYITLKLILKSFLPLLYVNWWYFTTYVIIMLFSPWLNKMLKSLEIDEYKKLIVDLVVVFTVSRFAYGSLSDSFSGFAFGKLIPCFNLYVIGAYLKLWHDQPHITRGGYQSSINCSRFQFLLHKVFGADGKVKKNILLSTIGLLLYVGIIGTVIFAGHFLNVEKLMQKYSYFVVLESPFVVFIVYELFLVAIKSKPFFTPFINKVASSSFGIYLIHEHQLMAVWLFPVLLKNVELYQTKWFIPSAIASVVVVFIVCSIIDLLRQKLLSGVKEKVISWIDSRYSLINH